MENTEIKNDIIEEVAEVCENTETSGGGLGFILGFVGVGIVLATATYIYKNKQKFEDRKIEKLRKKGYTIYKAELIEDGENCVVDSEIDD